MTIRRETQYFSGVRNTDDAIMRRTRVRSATTGQFSLWSQAKREYLLNDANLSVVAITDETFGAVGQSREELAASGALYDADNPMLAVSEVSGAVAGEALQGAALGGVAKIAQCGTAMGEAAKAGFQAKAAYDKANAVIDGVNTAVDVCRKLADGDVAGIAQSVDGTVGRYLAGKAADKFAAGFVCFSPGTSVQTQSGPLPIESISVGQRV